MDSKDAEQGKQTSNIAFIGKICILDFELKGVLWT